MLCVFSNCFYWNHIYGRWAGDDTNILNQRRKIREKHFFYCLLVIAFKTTDLWSQVPGCSWGKLYTTVILLQCQATWFSTQGIEKRIGLFLRLSQWQGSNSGTEWMEASDAKLPTMHMTVLHKIPTAHSGLTIVVVTSRWLPVAFPLVTVPNHFCSSQKHSVTALSSYSCFLRLFTQLKLTQIPSLFPLLFSLCAHPVLLPAPSEKGIFLLLAKDHNSSTQAHTPPLPQLCLLHL